MLTQYHKQKQIVAKLNDNQLQGIKYFIQGAVYCYCKNNANQYFAARDLFGGQNNDWNKTPLIELYKWHENNRSKDPIIMAGKDIGWILLNVIIEDNREFELSEEYTHKYRWTGGYMPVDILTPKKILAM